MDRSESTRQKTHDYRDSVRGWGHDITYRLAPGDQLDATGWGQGIGAGDYLLLSNGASDTRYRVDLITYYRDPADMWKAVLSFAPRAAAVEADRAHPIEVHIAGEGNISTDDHRLLGGLLRSAFARMSGGRRV